MSDGKLQYEVEITGTAEAAAGLARVETGLDKVASAEKRTRESAYGARQAHEDWVAGYKGEVFSEMAEKIKRVSHVSRETNPNLKWMGEGFKAAGKEAAVTSGALGGLRSGTVAASSASLAFSRLMRGDFVGAARAATMAVNSIWSAILSNPYAAMAVVAITALAGLVTWHKKAADAAREQARAQRELNDEILGAAGHGLTDVVSETAANMTDQQLRQARDARAADVEQKKAAAQEAGYRSIQGPGWHLIDGKRRYKSRGALDNEAKEAMREYQESASALRAYNDEMDRRNGKPVGASQGYGSGSGPTEKHRSVEYNEREWLAQDIKNPVARKSFLLQGAKDDLAAFDKENPHDFMPLEEEKLNHRKQLVFEIAKLEREVTREREAQAASEEDARKNLQARKEEYELSKKTTAEQLKTVDAKMAALRKGPKNTETEGQMLDLRIRRDALAERLAAERRENPIHPEEEDDASDDGRRVVDGADYSMKEFNPGRRRFRGMGRQGFMGKGQGHAAAWFSAQTAGRFAAAGHIGVPTEMGRPPMDVKGIDQTNRLLAEIKERL